MSVSIANDQVEDGGIEQPQNVTRRAGCRVAQQGKTVWEVWTTLAGIFAVRRDAATSLRVRSAPSKNAASARFWRLAVAAHPRRTLENWRNCAMHPCVRCVSELLARCVASQPLNLAFEIVRSAMVRPFPASVAGGVGQFAGTAILAIIGGGSA